eukprot:m.244840 g.244840  ORF g.244840 m.244840 type:complete len:66 (+) comp54468_c0_seq3:1101-1298(+)
MVIGVTNPFFSQSFKSFPAVFRVAEAPSRLAKDSHSKVALSTMHFKPGINCLAGCALRLVLSALA